MFKAREATLRQVFDNGEYEEFIIPSYQRTYVWGADELENFWADFLVREENQGTLHLLGSLIISKDKVDNKVFGVVDGQQRLITSSLLIVAARDVWGSQFGVAEEDYYDLHRYIVKSDRAKGVVLKVRVSESIKEVYEDLLIAKQRPSRPLRQVDEKAVLSAYDFFIHKITESISRPGLSDKDKKDIVWSKVESLFDASCVLVTLDNEDDAYEVFEGFNARGVDLSIADLFKNLILQKINGTEEEKDRALSEWNEINQIVREIGIPKFSINTFLRYFWIRDHQYIGERELYKKIKKETKNYRELLSKLYKTAQSLKILFEDNPWGIKELIGGENKYSDSINKSLRALKVMNTQSYLVWLMSLVDEENRKHISAKWISKSLKQVEIFTFRYFGVSKLPANRVEKFYAKLSRNLFKEVREGNVASVQTRVLNDLAMNVKEEDLLPTKEQFIIDFQNINLQANNKPFIRYLLSTLEVSMTSAEKIIDQQTVNIEHILPQKPSKEWQITTEELKRSLNRLGNITILLEKINSDMSNKPIKQKVEHLNKSKLKLNDGLVSLITANNYTWGPEQIGIRQTELAELADKEWSFA